MMHAAVAQQFSYLFPPGDFARPTGHGNERLGHASLEMTPIVWRRRRFGTSFYRSYSRYADSAFIMLVASDWLRVLHRPFGDRGGDMINSGIDSCDEGEHVKGLTY